MWLYLVLATVVFTPPKAEKPTLAHLMKMKLTSGEKIQIIKQIAPQWKQLGVFLNFDPEGWKLDLLGAEHKLDGPVGCCQATMKHWLMGNGIDATWEVLLELLDDIDHSELTKQALHSYDNPSSAPVAVPHCYDYSIIGSGLIY